MTESFITGAFQKMGEYPKNVKLMRSKNTGETAGYAFVDFYDPVSVMHKLNGKYIPDTNPVSCIFYFELFCLVKPSQTVGNFIIEKLATTRTEYITHM